MQYRHQILPALPARFMTRPRAELPARSAADLNVASDGARLLYEAGAQRVWICGSLAHGQHWDAVSDLDYATLGISPEQRAAVAIVVSAQCGRNVDIIALEDAPPYVRVQITEAMIPVDRFGRTAAVTYGLLNPPVATLVRRPLPRQLHRQRHAAVLELLARSEAQDVLDVGCGEGPLIGAIVNGGVGSASPSVAAGTRPRQARVIGIDPDPVAIAAARTHLERTLTDEQRARVELRQVGVERLDSVWRGQDAIVAVEVIEHLNRAELARTRSMVFEVLRPSLVILTTPNADFNALFARRGLRDRHHRFEWSRDELRAWAVGAACSGGYSVAISGVGEPHAEYGHPSQLCHFIRNAA
jgi:2-polyprenyl-3-methyl-5-hydroxy-6-metoxy-1,4-benzoquinol methylase